MQVNVEKNRQNFSGKVLGYEILSPQNRNRILPYMEDLNKLLLKEPCDLFLSQSKKGSIIFSSSKKTDKILCVPKGSRNYLEVAKQSIEAYKQELKEYIKFFSEKDRISMWAKFRLQTNKVNQ